MRAPLKEAALIYLWVTVGTFLLTRLRDLTVARDWVHLGVGALFLVTAVKLAQREPDGMRRYGIDLAGVLTPPDEDADRGFLGLGDLGRALRGAALPALKETGVALLVAIVVFPPFAIGFYLYHQPAHAFAWSVPPDLASFALAQLLVVGLPEEMLFRGYFQTRLGDVFERRVRLLGAEVSPAALVIQAVLFAVIHFVVDGHPARLAVFFPGLLFGWLRAHRDGVGAAVAFHAMSNVYADLLVRGWLR